MGSANVPGLDASAMPTVGYLPRDAGINCTKPYKLRRLSNE